MDYVLILGANSDIARPLSYLYAKAGYGLLLASRDFPMLQRLADDLKVRYQAVAVPLAFDITRTGDHQRFYDSLPEKPAGVVCLAGYLGDQLKAEKDFAEAAKVIATNYLGCVSVLGVIANDFEQRGHGFIVGVSSVAGERGRKSNYIYGSAKAGFSTFLSGLRNRMAAKNVQVLTVHPGFVSTKMIEGVETPRLLTATPEEAARDIFNAQRQAKDKAYTKWFWRFIMLIINSIPEKLFKRLSL